MQLITNTMNVLIIRMWTFWTKRLTSEQTQRPYFPHSNYSSTTINIVYWSIWSEYARH